MRLIVRADANPAIGSGHLMRDLALAQAWRRRSWPVTVVTRCDSESLLARFEREGCEIQPMGGSASVADDLQATCAAGDPRTSWITLDGYGFDASYHGALKQAGFKLLVVDDCAHLPRYDADVILNQNLHASRLQYRCDDATLKLLGPAYLLLRREFVERASAPRDIAPVATKLLITLGGSDAHAQTEKVLDAVTSLRRPELEAIVVLGPHRAPIDAPAAGGVGSVTVQRDPADMAGLMAWADLAVSGGGTSTWEMAAMGLPHAIVTLADNQRPVAREAAAAGSAIDLGWYGDVSREAIARTVDALIDDGNRRRAMSTAGRQLIDGRGPGRIVRALLSRSLRLRRIGSQDAGDLWRWANDPEVRAASFSSEPIPWETHVAWLADRLASASCHDFAVMNAKDDRPIGQVRFDVDGGDATISVSLDEGYRHRGYGAAAIALACDSLFAARDVRRIIALVKRGNESSLRAFRGAGFTEVTDPAPALERARVFELVRPVSRPS